MHEGHEGKARESHCDNILEDLVYISRLNLNKIKIPVLSTTTPMQLGKQIQLTRLYIMLVMNLHLQRL